MAKYARLKAYDRKEGNLLRRLTVRSRRMIAGRWYKVSDDFALELAKVHQPYPPGQTSSAKTPLAFEVAATKTEQKAVEKASQPLSPTEATTDLTGGRDLKTTDFTASEPAPKAKPTRRSSRRRG